jgi:hypothetical protein
MHLQGRVTAPPAPTNSCPFLGAGDNNPRPEKLKPSGADWRGSAHVCLLLIPTKYQQRTCTALTSLSLSSSPQSPSESRHCLPSLLPLARGAAAPGSHSIPRGAAARTRTRGGVDAHAQRWFVFIFLIDY